jgi:hypothetical protein
MKVFSHFKLTKELVVLLFTFGVIVLLYFAFPDYHHHRTLHVQAQLPQQYPLPMMAIKITSPMPGEEVPVGELTISGTSIDDATADCQVYVDLNDQKRFQKAVATGPGGVNDYSTWNFTYTPEYHPITNGTNNLISKLSCVGDDSNGSTANITKSYNVKVIGVKEYSESDTIGDSAGNVSEGTTADTGVGARGDIGGGTTGGTSGGARGDIGGGTTGGTSGGARGDTVESPYGNPSRGTTGSITGGQ